MEMAERVDWQMNYFIRKVIRWHRKVNGDLISYTSYTKAVKIDLVSRKIGQMANQRHPLFFVVCFSFFVSERILVFELGQTGEFGLKIEAWEV